MTDRPKANLREETLNTYLALLLDKYDGISATAERRSRQQAIDVTVTHEHAAAPISIYIEAKVGDSPSKRREAEKQARSRLSFQPRALAWGLCYPAYLQDGSISARATQKALAEAEMAFAPVSRLPQTLTWRKGTVADLADELLNSELSQKHVADAIEYTVHEAAGILFNAGSAPALADALALPKTSKELRAAALIASLMLSNAALLHHRLRLVDHLSHIVSLKEALLHPPIFDQEDMAPKALQAAWEAILRIDYHPVFVPALAVLKVLADKKSKETVRRIAENALLLADELASLRFDHAGPLYHRLLASAKYDGSFYTNNVSALLLARLALNEGAADWQDANAIAKLKVVDPACGTGTLLMAAMHTMRDRHQRTAETEIDLLHLALVEDVLYGFDINRHGIQLAACNLTLGNPRVDYSRMNLFTMKHGPQDDGTAKAGSLELLATARDETDVASLTSPLPTTGALGAEHVEAGGAGPTEKLIGEFDLVIMNPPFTRNDIRNRQYDKGARRSVQEREIQIAQSVRTWENELAFKAIDQTSVSTFFSPLADVLLKEKSAGLAKVVPTTALTNSSGAPERQFLADRFQIETIVTSHDPTCINFSENTSIHESLMIARRPEAERKPTRFISLARMPRDAHEALQLADVINGNQPLDDWGTQHQWPWPRIREGDWSAAQFYDGTLAHAVRDLEALAGTTLRAAGELCHIEPGGQRIRDAFLRDPPKNAPWTVPILWDHSTDVLFSMEAVPDVVAAPKPGKEDYARGRLAEKASRLLVANRLYTHQVRVAACYAAAPLLGSAWVPVRPIAPNPAFEQALCAWWNSTPGILTLLHCRAKKLTYPRYALDSLRSLLVPDPERVDLAPLVDAFTLTRAETLLPWPQMHGCPGRALLDQAAAQVLSIDGRRVAAWRERIAGEPTVCNRRPFGTTP